MKLKNICTKWIMQKRGGIVSLAIAQNVYMYILSFYGRNGIYATCRVNFQRNLANEVNEAPHEFRHARIVRKSPSKRKLKCDKIVSISTNIGNARFRWQNGSIAIESTARKIRYDITQCIFHGVNWPPLVMIRYSNMLHFPWVQHVNCGRFICNSACVHAHTCYVDGQKLSHRKVSMPYWFSGPIFAVFFFFSTECLTRNGHRM